MIYLNEDKDAKLFTVKRKKLLCLLAMNFTLWKKSHVQNNAIKNRNQTLTWQKKKKKNETDAQWQCFVSFLSLSNLHHYVKQDTVLQSQPAGFPDKTEDKRRTRVEMGNATQQLGANWRGIHYLLLPGKLVFYGKEMLLSDWWGQEAPCSVVGGGQHYGAAKVSREVLKIAYERMEF